MKNLFFVFMVALMGSIFFTSCQKDEINAEERRVETNFVLDNNNVDDLTAKVLADYVNVYKDIEDEQFYYIGIGLSQEVYAIDKQSNKVIELLDLIEYASFEKLPLEVYLSDDGTVMDIQKLTETKLKIWQDNEGLHYDVLENVDTTAATARGYSKYFNSKNSLQYVLNYLRAQGCDFRNSNTYPCITFQYKTDGCYARAHKMKQVLENTYGKTCDKIFAYGFMNSGCGSNYGWKFHVAPLVYVNNTKYVLDPTIAGYPLTVNEWTSKLSIGWNKFVCTTAIKPGYYYYPKNAGNCRSSGYYQDSSTYNHTNYTLLRYKNRQGC